MIVLAPPKTQRDPYEFTGSYASCYDFADAAMDKRHVFMLHGVLCAWPFASALEIGCFNGASSTAFVEALNKGEGLGAEGVATFCDVSVSESLMDVAMHCRHAHRVRITPQPSWQVLDSNEFFDFILVDAAHDLDSVTLELKRLMRRRPLCVMAHDTSATAAGFSKCEGAEFLKHEFQKQSDYRCIEDNARRDGERTERGLFLATSSDALYRKACAVFEEWKNR
jgi:hypothetical protein